MGPVGGIRYASANRSGNAQEHNWKCKGREMREDMTESAWERGLMKMCEDIAEKFLHQVVVLVLVVWVAARGVQGIP